MRSHRPPVAHLAPLGSARAGVSGQRPETLDFKGKSEPLREVWVAVRASLGSVLEQVTLADVAAGELPASVRALTESPDAWVSH